MRDWGSRPGGAAAPRRTRLGSIAVLGAVASMSISVTSAEAAGTINLTVGADPAESITTQLGASGSGMGAETYLNLKVKPAGGQGCAANANADDGTSVGSGDINEPNPTYAETDNRTFQTAGAYLLCGWISNFAETTIYAQASLPFTVRPPHLSLAIGVPATVQPGQTFQVGTTAQAETERSAYEYMLPDTGSGCPANADAADSASGSRAADFNNWNVVGGPLMQSMNVTLSTPGVYLFCAYFEYPGTASPPEATAIARTTVAAPPPPPPHCVVPQLGGQEPLALMQQSLSSGHCTPGFVRYTASRTVARGNVLGLTSAPGSQLAAGASVGILVSTGPPCVVPTIRLGATQASVQRAIRAAHCSVGRISYTHAKSIHQGRVIALSPDLAVTSSGPGGRGR